MEFGVWSSLSSFEVQSSEFFGGGFLGGWVIPSFGKNDYGLRRLGGFRQISRGGYQHQAKTRSGTETFWHETNIAHDFLSYAAILVSVLGDLWCFFRSLCYQTTTTRLSYNAGAQLNTSIVTRPLS